MPTHTTTKLIEHHGISLWARRDGDPARPCVLLVAGANASHLMWPDEFSDLLVSRGFSVIRYDHRDTGQSSKLDFDTHPYALADLANDMIAVLDGFGVRKAHVVGMSMGGTLVQLALLDHPERLLSATIMLTAALDVDFAGNIARAYTGEPVPQGLPLPHRAVLDQLSLRNAPVDSLAQALQRRVSEWVALSGPLARLKPEEFRTWEARAIAHAGNLLQPVNHARAQPVPLQRGAELSGVRVPVLVIQGGQDPLNPPPHGRHIAALIPASTLVEIPELGHSLPSSLHQRVADCIVAHLLQHGVQDPSEFRAEPQQEPAMPDISTEALIVSIQAVANEIDILREALATGDAEPEDAETLETWQRAAENLAQAYKQVLKITPGLPPYEELVNGPE